MRVALATYSKLPELNDDDRLLIQALAERGVDAVPAVWDSASVHWEDFQGVLVRSCWDYHLRLDEFLRWIARIEAAVWNPAPVLRWNSHKRYLRDLAARNVPVVATRWLERGDAVDLAQLLQTAGWGEAVVKPAVSASAHGTWRTSLAAARADQPRLEQILQGGDVLVQAFMPEVRDAGEWSLLFFAGRFSHAVLKRPGAGDYRVQWEFGGSADACTPTRELIADAARALAAVPEAPLYARVDGVAREGRLVLMELELIEPHLFLGWSAGAADRLATALHGAIAGQSTRSR